MPDYRARVKRVGVLVCVIAMLALLLGAYVRVGWERMETACAANPPGARSWSSVEFGWSWAPTGFQCTYDDGSQRTSYWF
jgi:hypothetical protein